MPASSLAHKGLRLTPRRARWMSCQSFAKKRATPRSRTSDCPASTRQATPTSLSGQVA